VMRVQVKYRCVCGARPSGNSWIAYTDFGRCKRASHFTRLIPAIYDAYKLVQAYTGIGRILMPHNPDSRFYNHDIDHKISPLFVEHARTLHLIVNATL
jgi:hypothetical protein